MTKIKIEDDSRYTVWVVKCPIANLLCEGHVVENAITDCIGCKYFRGSTQSTTINKRECMLANPKYIYCAYRERK